MVLFTIALVVMMSFAALASDIGLMWRVKLQMQGAADAAAVAGADALLAGGSGAPSTAAQALSSTNGFTDGSPTSWSSHNVSVTVNNPPASGAFTGNSSAVEVIISQLQPSFFAGTLGFASMTVTARSVALSSSGPNCVYSLDPAVSGALTMTSGASISSSCGVLVNSSSSSAININSGASISAPSIGVVGGVSSGSGASTTPAPVTGVAGFPDPLSNVPAPSVGTCTSKTVPLGSSSLSSGYYCGLNVNSGASLTLNSGSYSFNGNFNVTSGASVTGTGVTLYFKSGTLAETSGATINLSAPTSGSYSGILVFEDRSNSTQMNVNSGASLTLTGALYLPDANLTITSGATINNVYSILVADSITVTSGASISLNANYSGLSNGSPIRTAVLAE